MKYLIVLGAGMANNKELSDTSKLRYDKALEIETNYNAIICTGDRFWKYVGREDLTTEAQAGKEYLLSKGFPEKKIVLETKSRDTFSQAYFLRKEFLEEDKEFTVITSPFHMPKTKLLFNLVFTDDYTITFVESDQPQIILEHHKKKLIAEKIVIEFYKEHLEKTYHLKRGDLEAIGNFILNTSVPFSGEMDEYHKELTRKVEEATKNVSGEDN